jgi:hypothetical protein
MPTPKPDETRKDFVSRCIPVVIEDGTAKDNDQAVAVCNSLYSDSKKSLSGFSTKEIFDFVSKAGKFEQDDAGYIKSSSNNCDSCKFYLTDDCKCQVVVGATSKDCGCDLYTEEVTMIDDTEVKGSFGGLVTSFSDLEAAEEAAEMARDVQDMTSKFSLLASNIMSSPEIEDKGAALQELATEFADMVQKPIEEKKSKWQELKDNAKALLTGSEKQKPVKTEGGVKFPASDFAFVPDPEKPSTWKLRLSEGRAGNVTVRQLGRAAAALSPGGFRGQKVQIPTDKLGAVKRRIRSEYVKLDVDREDMPASVKSKSGFTVCKDVNGQYRWTAIFSNKFRDRDNPPEILSDAAHKDFVKAVQSGSWEMPELWLWHTLVSESGIADFITYYDDGFIVATGMFDKDREFIAEALMDREDYLLVSHGMPAIEINRDDKDRSIITRYRTSEISVLPDWAAANELTGFQTINSYGGKDMGIPAKDREHLAQLIGEDATAALENDVKSKASSATADGLEFKEVEDEELTETEEVKTEAEVEVEAEKTEAAENTEDVTEVESVDAEEVETETEETKPAISAEEIAKAIGDVINPLVDRVIQIEQTVKALSKSDEEKAVAAASLTPAASLEELVKQSVIGRFETQIDGRSSLAKDGPKETTASDTGISLVDALKSGQNWRNVIGYND